MLARDIAPNRLERAKISLSDDLLPALGGDRVGLIAFAGAASLKCPLTSDYGFFRLTLDEISTRSAPRGGTLIGGAIRKAGEAFSDDLGNYKIILLITDGEDQESFPVEAARAVWADRQIPIVAVALGDPREGARIPVETGSGEGYLEHRGEVVWSKADFTQLRQVAEVSDLKAFIPVGTRNFDLGEIYRERIVPAIDFQRREETEQIARPSQYHPFAAAALALLLIESFLRDGRRRPARSAATGAILASDERTDKRTDKGTDRRTYKRTERTERTDKGADERSAAA
jgi:Ca-activated chloride channel family protein